MTQPERLSSISGPSPQRVFILLAALFQLWQALMTFPLVDGQVVHVPERYLHVVQLANTGITGRAGTIPSAYPAFVYMITPQKMKDRFGDQFPRWRREVKDRVYPGLRGESCVRGNSLSRWDYLDCLRSVKLPQDTTLSIDSHAYASEYSPLGYLTYLPGAWVGLVLKLHPFTTLYLSGLTHAALMIALFSAVIRISPVLGWPLALLMLLPTPVAQRAYFYPDGMAVGLNWLFIALVLRLRASPRLLTHRQLAGLALLGACIAVVKIVYVLVPLLLLLIPASCFRDNRIRTLFVAGTAVAGLALAVAWNTHSLRQHYALPEQEIALTVAPVPEKEELGTRMHLLHVQQLVFNPERFLMAFARTFGTSTGVCNLMGKTAFWPKGDRNWDHCNRRDAPLLWTWFPLLLICAWLEGAGKPPLLSRGGKALAAGIFLSTALGIAAIILLFWGFRINEGREFLRMFQGYYLLPVWPLLLLLARDAGCFLPLFPARMARSCGLAVLVAIIIYMNYQYPARF